MKNFIILGLFLINGQSRAQDIDTAYTAQSTVALPSAEQKVQQSAFPQTNMLMLSAFAGRGGGVTPFINCSSGNCSFDVPTVTNQMLLASLNQTQAITRTRYIGLIEEARKSVNEVVKATFSNAEGDKGLYQLSLDSQASTQPLKFDEVIKAYGKYQALYTEATTNLEILESFFQGEFEGIPIADKNIIKSLPTTLKNNVSMVKTKLYAGLATVGKLIASRSYEIELPSQENIGRGTGNGQIFSADPLTGELTIKIKSKGPNGSPEVINKMTAEIKALNTRPAGLVDAVKSLHAITKSYIDAFITEYGAKESAWSTAYSWLPSWVGGGLKQTNVDVATALKTDYDELIRIFFIRSSMRLATGTPVGSFDISYEGNADRSDLFKADAKVISELPEEVLYDQPDVTSRRVAAEKKFRLALTTSGSKALITKNSARDATVQNGIGSIGGLQDNPESVIDGEYSMIDSANSIWSLIVRKENSQQWKVLHMILKLLAADFYEEKLLTQAGGLKRLSSFYRARYIDIPFDDRQRYEDAKSGFSMIFGDSSAYDSSDNYGDLADQSENSLPGQLKSLKQQIDVFNTNRGVAQLKQATLDFYQGKFTMEIFKKSEKRMKDIWNK